jgi:hypothetical protein
VIDADNVPPMTDTDEAMFDGDPIPLTQTMTVPPFPVGSLPQPVAEMVTAVSEFTQTDPGMPATSALSVLSACTGGHAVIEIRGGWRETLNLYTATVAAPGERKSAVQQLLAYPLMDTEKQLADKGIAARIEAETRRHVAEQTAERLKREASKADGTDAWSSAMADAIGGAQLAAQIEIPAVPRILADDITPEKAATLLAEQGGRLAIISAEGGIFDIIAGRYSNNLPNMDLWLKGHSGDMLRVDRASRAPEYVPHPALTLGLMIQPAVLQAIAANPMFRGRGLLARVLYALPESKVGHRRIAPTPINTEVVERYNTTIAGLAAGMHEWCSDPAVLVLTGPAREAMLTIEEKVEPTLADDGRLAHLKDWGSKYVGAIARIAGIIHLAKLGSDKGPYTPVDAVTILEAARIGDYFEVCAINAFTRMRTDQCLSDALYLLERIAHAGLGEMSERDMFSACNRSRFPTKDAMNPALVRLVDHGYLAPLETARKPGGGRAPSPRFRVHPRVAFVAYAAEP